MKYLFINDIHYLFNKEKLLFLIIIIGLLVGSIVSINNEASLFEMLTRSTGTNLNLEEFDTIEFIMYLLNIVCFLYLIVRIYIKDINANLENIYLRINNSRFIVNKIICSMFLSFLIKVIQYLIPITIFTIIVNKTISFEVISLFISDILYILFLQFVFLIIYLLYILLKKNIIFLLFPMIIFMIVIPKNIYSIFNYSIYYIFGLLIVLVLIYLIFNKKCKTLLENI